MSEIDVLRVLIEGSSNKIKFPRNYIQEIYEFMNTGKTEMTFEQTPSWL